MEGICYTSLLFPSNSPVLIGRDEGSDLCLRDRAVSSRHAKVLYTKNNNNKWTLQIIDLGSTNGTMVNGDSIQASPLLIGDYIEIGDVALRVSLLSEQEIEHLQRILSRLSQANTDPLTGLYTRAFYKKNYLKLSRAIRNVMFPSVVHLSIWIVSNPSMIISVIK